jgi:hypothetical protein
MSGTGSAYDGARYELANPSNFGPTGTEDVDFMLRPAIQSITAANLADTDIFWAGLLLNGAPLSAVGPRAPPSRASRMT